MTLINEEQHDRAQKFHRFFDIFGDGGNDGFFYCCGATTVGSGKSYYARVPYPTEAEGQALQELAMSQGTDYFGILKDLPDDQQAWSKIFALSLRFKEFDRSAQVYGYTLFAAFYYFMDYAGEARFADLINAQPPEVRQRVHDFLYYDVVSDDPGSDEE
ncbi:hypothetical protein LP420_34975 [Massilia sp. B-10]|nr:hypothetical protein LP420_34975 [Massilia sp. B-10]